MKFLVQIVDNLHPATTKESTEDHAFDEHLIPRARHISVTAYIMRMKFLRLLTMAVFLVVAGSASTEESGYAPSELEISKIKEWLLKVGVTVRLTTDPLKRAIVCRVAFQRFTLNSMARATGISRAKILRAVEEIEAMHLVRLTPAREEDLMIEPYDPKAREKMRGWAHDWCDNDDTCEVSR